MSKCLKFGLPFAGLSLLIVIIGMVAWAWFFRPQRREEDQFDPPTGWKSNTQEFSFVLEHYKRCEQSWRSLLTTIWSIPSVAAALNVGAYSFLFDEERDIGAFVLFMGLGVLLVLNLLLFAGVWKHVLWQDKFGNRVRDLDAEFGLSLADPGGLPKTGYFYVVAMAVITVLNIFAFSYAVFCRC